MKSERENVLNTSSQSEAVQYAFLLNAFFDREFSDPAQLLDKNKSKYDREARAYVCLKIEFEKNTYLIPLKKDLGSSLLTNPFYKNSHYPVPSKSKPNAGLDFRKIIIANDPSLYRIDEAKISSAQKRIIQDNFETIKSDAIDYIKGFIKAAEKNRHKKSSLYNFSALSNFLDELGIDINK